MSLNVLKFGGTSLGTIERIKIVAQIIKDQILKKNKVVVVVSAQVGVTNKVLSMCMDISPINNVNKSFEVDSALSTGETLSASLLALALLEIGVNARSMQAWQVGIISNNNPNSALIESVNTKIIKEMLSDGIIPVITGFQALSSSGRITTIGRGGSDTSAAVIAASLKADYCDIYTDVEGLYTCDPRLVLDAKIIKTLTYEETIELAGSGAKVLHPRAVENCMRYGIILRVFSSFNQKCGTVIMSDVNEIRKITGISYLKKMSIFKRINLKRSLSEFMSVLAENSINIHQILSYENSFLSFSALNEYESKLLQVLNENNYEYYLTKNVGSIIIVGASIRHDSIVLSNILKIFETNNIKILAIVNSEIKLAVFMDDSEIEKIVKILHGDLIK